MRNRLTGRQTRHLISRRNRRAVQYSKPTTTPQSHRHCRRAGFKTGHGDYLTAADSPMRHPPSRGPVTPLSPCLSRHHCTVLLSCTNCTILDVGTSLTPIPISTPHHPESPPALPPLVGAFGPSLASCGARELSRSGPISRQMSEVLASISV